MELQVWIRRAEGFHPPAHATHPLAHALRITADPVAAVINTDLAASGEDLSTWCRNHLGGIPIVESSALGPGPLEQHLPTGSVIALHPPDAPPQQTRRQPERRCPTPASPMRTAAGPSLILSIEHGPDMGKTFTLGRGTYTVGRGAANLRIADPSMSREHARIELSGAHARLHAAPHSGKILVNGAPVSSQELRSGDRIYLGSTEIAVYSPADLLQPLRFPGPPASPIQIKAQPSSRGKFVVLLGALLPLVLGVVMAVAFASWFFLAFSAVGAITGIAGIFGAPGGKKYRRELAQASRAFELRRRVATIVPHLLTLGSPGQGINAAPADHKSTWCGSINLGLTTITAPLLHADGTPLEPSQLSVIERLPVTLDLGPGVFARVMQEGNPTPGEPSPSTQLLAQLGALSRVGRIPPVILTSSNPSWIEPWRFASGLTVTPPHRLDLLRLATARVIVTDDLDLVADHVDVTDALIWITDSARPTPPRDVALPHTVTVQLTPARGTLFDPRMTQPERFVPDAQSTEALLDSCGVSDHRDASALAADPNGTLPTMVDLDSLTGRGADENSAHESAAVEIGTSAEVASTVRFPIGLSQEGIVEIDLERDGPHFLVAGTTGSGKSELLRSMILSLAHAASPRDVNFLMIDFKGGAGLAPFQPLPHFAGLITDLGLESIERTLECLRAEIRYRKRLFGAVNASDLRHYRELSPEGERLARLVIVVDEFRMLSEESPAAVTELMRIATIGRSLGLHLILCTQRPQGAMNADIRANITTTVALRMAHAAESIDVTGTDIAASIDSRTPGRAYLKIAQTEPLEFQSASTAIRAGAHALAPEAVQTFAHWLTARERPAIAPAPDALPRAVAALTSRWQPADRVRRPVSDPLPASLLVGESSEAESDEIDLGVQDLPFEQRVAPVKWNPHRHGHLALVGSPQSGTSRVIGHLISHLLSMQEDALVYIMDGDRTLGSLQGHGAIAGYQSQESVIDSGRFVERLHEIAMQAARDTGTAADTAGPHMCLVITGWGAWSALFRQGRYTWIEDKLIELARPAYRRHITIVVTGERELLTSKLSAEASNRVTLSYERAEDMTMLLPKMPHSTPIPGRGFLQGSLVEPSNDNPFTGTTVQLRERDLATHPLPRTLTAPEPRFRIEPLPFYACEPSSIPGIPSIASVHRATQGAPWSVSLGIAAYPTREHVITIESGTLLLIIGSSGSGKSSLLTRIGTVIAGPNAHILKGTSAAAATEIRELLGRARAGDLDEQPPILLIDDMDRLPPASGQDLADLGHAGLTIVATAGNRPGLFARCPVTLGARGGNGVVLLSPDKSGDAENFGYRLETEYPAPRGRAFVLGGPQAIAVQTYAPQDSESVDVA